MFKKTNKTYTTSQKTTLRPLKNVAIYEENEEDLETEELCDENHHSTLAITTTESAEMFEDDSSSCYSNDSATPAKIKMTDTMLLAQFLSSTGPEEYTAAKVNEEKDESKGQQQFKRASKLLNRLRKKTTMPGMRLVLPPAVNTNTNNTNRIITLVTPEKKKYIPLPAYKEALHDKNDNKAEHKSYSPPTLPSSTTINNYPVKTKTARQIILNSLSPAGKDTTTQTSQNNSLSSNNSKRSSVTASNNSSTFRDSGVYSETASERDCSASVSATLASYLHPSHAIRPLPSFLNDIHSFPQPPYGVSISPRRPAPLPPAAFAACSSPTASSCSPTTTVYSSSTAATTSPSHRIQSVPEAALKRKSVRLRHVQVQTETNSKEGEIILTDVSVVLGDRQSCPHCRQNITHAREADSDINSSNSIKTNRLRRPSCPPALSSGLLHPKEQEKEMNESAIPGEGGDNDGNSNTKTLLEMIMKLKSELTEEKQCRIELEKTVKRNQQEISEERKGYLAKEKDRWAGECLWLNDRIALLPE